MRLALIPLLACLALPAAAQVHNSPDSDVTAALGPSTSYLGPKYRAFDADWTADGRLAFAVAMRGYTSKYDSDKLVIGVYDPASGDTNVLGTLPGPYWVMDHVSLSVPDRYYDEEGTGSPDGTTPIHALNKVHVAIGAVAPVWGTYNGQEFTKHVRAVRLLSVSFTSSDPELVLASPAEGADGTSGSDAQPPWPELCLRTSEEGYVLDLAWVDPMTQLPAGGQVMLASSFDQGATLGKVCYVTGPCSAIAKDPKSPLSDSIYAKPVLGWDEQGGNLMLAVEDATRGVVHVATSADGKDGFQVAASTSAGGQAHHEPRMAVRKGEASVTYLVGEPNSYGWRPLDWVRASAQGGLVQHPRITDRARTRGDIEVHGNDAFIVVSQAPDQGVKDSEVATYDMSRTDAFDVPVSVRVNDQEDLGLYPPVSAVTGEHALLQVVKGALFHHFEHTTNQTSGWMLDR